MNRAGLIFFLMVSSAHLVRADATSNPWFVPDAMGARLGYCPQGRNEDFAQGDVFLDWQLPFGWDGEDKWQGWYFEWWLEGSLGGLFRGSDAAVVGTVGPTLKGGHRECPVYFQLGCSPTVISQAELDGVDFGGNYHFTSHVGLGYQINSHWEIEYRLQHMSNFGLESPNPGLNLHAFSLRFRF